MKVYAQYFAENGLQFRCHTLLQFGNSWELIGNAVLTNPGSASPVADAIDKTIDDIASFYDPVENPDLSTAS